jgi:hypothetical protein
VELTLPGEAARGPDAEPVEAPAGVGPGLSWCACAGADVETTWLPAEIAPDGKGYVSTRAEGVGGGPLGARPRP